MEIAHEADEVVDGIGAWSRKHKVDAHYVKAGYLRVNAFPSEPPDWDEAVERLRAAGVGDELQPVDPAGVQRACASPAFREGLLMPSAASVQPALLARGLRRVLLKRGVRFSRARTSNRSGTTAERGRGRTAVSWTPTRRSSRSTPGPPAGRTSAAASSRGAATWSSPSRSPTALPSSAGPAGSCSATRASRSVTSGPRVTGGSRSAPASARPATAADGGNVHPRPPRGRARRGQLPSPLPDAP